MFWRSRQYFDALKPLFYKGLTAPWKVSCTHYSLPIDVKGRAIKP
jgi:hypothetical protein